MKKSNLFCLFTLVSAKFYFVNASGIEQHRKNPREMTQTSDIVQGLSYLHSNIGTETDTETNIPKIDETISDEISFNVLSFAHDMGKLLNDQYSTKNEVYSPVSIMASLAFLLLGSKGKSHQELSSAFGLTYKQNFANYPAKFHKEFGQMLEDIENKNSAYPSITNWRNTQRNNIRNLSKNKTPAEHIIKISNGLFVQEDYNINDDFNQVMNLVYHSDLRLLNFQRYPENAKFEINSWVSKNTYGKIKSIVNDNFHRNINVIIASTLYFKAFWENSFFESATTTDFFYPDGIDNPPINIKMMATGGVFPFYDSVEYKCRIIGLPYKGNLTTMYVIQPHHSSRYNLRELQKYLDANKIEELISKMTQKTAIIAFPKMHLTKSINMKNILNNFGIEKIFSRGISDLSLISATQKYLKPSTETPQTLIPDRSQILFPDRQQTFNSDRQQTLNSDRQQTFNSDRQQTLNSDRQQTFNSDSQQTFNSDRQQTLNSDRQQTLNSDRQQTLFSDRNASPKIYKNNNPAEGLIFTRNNGARRIPSVEHTEYGSILSRFKRQYNSEHAKIYYINKLENERYANTNSKSDLYVEDIVHKVDFDVNEHGTEAAAATLTYLRRTGTDVLFRAETPFLVLIRHDPTKLILFYGIINEPVL